MWFIPDARAPPRTHLMHKDNVLGQYDYNNIPVAVIYLMLLGNDYCLAIAWFSYTGCFD